MEYEYVKITENEVHMFKHRCDRACKDIGIDLEAELSFDVISGDFYIGCMDNSGVDGCEFWDRHKLPQLKEELSKKDNLGSFFYQYNEFIDSGKGPKSTVKYLFDEKDIEKQKDILMLAFLWGYVRQRDSLSYSRDLRRNGRDDYSNDIEDLYWGICRDLMGDIPEGENYCYYRLWHHSTTAVLPSERLNINELMTVEDLPLLFAVRMAEVFSHYRLVRLVSNCFLEKEKQEKEKELMSVSE